MTNGLQERNAQERNAQERNAQAETQVGVIIDNREVPNEQSQFNELLKEVGVTDLYEARKLKELLEAKKYVVTRNQTERGVFTEEAIPVTDTVAQIAAFKMLTQMRQRYTEGKKNSDLAQFLAKIFKTSQISGLIPSQKVEDTAIPIQEKSTS